MANHPNRTKANRERRIAREYRYWLDLTKQHDRELSDPFWEKLWSDIEGWRAVVQANAIGFASYDR